MSAPEAAVATALERAAVYGVLAGAFAYPVPERVRALAAQAATVAQGRAAGIAPAVARLAQAAAASSPEALAAEHAVLFDGPVRVPPYEGAWGPQPLGGKATQLADVAGFYAAFGLGPTAVHADMEDHVAAECEFMSALALKEGWALADGMPERAAVTRDAQSAFLRDHLGRWVDAFAAEVQAKASVPLYTEAASCLAAWVSQESARLGVTPARVSGASVAEEAPLACPMAPAGPEEAPT